MRKQLKEKEINFLLKVLADKEAELAGEINQSHGTDKDATAEMEYCQNITNEFN